MADRKVIALDGPAGAGKGTVCRAVAAHFELAYLDTGSIYRAMGLLSLRREERDEEALAALAAGMDFEFRFQAGGPRAFLDGEDVSEALREEAVGSRASEVAAMPKVREALLAFQRGYGGERDAILDGRDVGTVVWPDASLKIFLTASLEERAKRRALELQERGEPVNYSQVQALMAERDARDSGRAHAPLAHADDALLVDTTGKTAEEVINQVVQLVEQKLYPPAPVRP